MEALKPLVKAFGVDLILKYPNVVSVGVGYKEVKGQKTDELCVVIGVTKKLPEVALKPEHILPKMILDVKTDVIELGEFRALSYVERMRPCPGGYSIGHKDITAGTVGLPVVYKKESGEALILSNNHVLANCNEAAIGDAILQPGAYDGGHIEVDQIATLEEYVAINWIEPSECSVARGYAAVGNFFAELFQRKSRFYTVVNQPNPNVVDCALAKPLRAGDMADFVKDIGKPQGVNFNLELGMPIHKTGRTTGHTTGVITQLYATITVAYSSSMLGKRAIFTDQIIADHIGDPGDSGSSLFDMNNNVIGLLFAGSDEATVFNTAENVFTLLEIELE